MANASLVDSDNQAGNSGQTTWTQPWSGFAGEAANDYVVWVMNKENTDTPTPGSGVTLYGPYTSDSGGFHFETWIAVYKVAGGESGTKTIGSWTNATYRQVLGACIRNLVTAEAPVITISADVETSQNVDPVHPGITIARSNSALVFATGNFAGTTQNVPTATGVTFVSIGSGGETGMFWDVSSVPTGATGTITGDMVSDPEWPLSIVFELATEAGGGAPAVVPLPDRRRRMGRG